MCSSARWCPSLRSWEAAVVKPQGGDGFVLRIHEQESVAATEVMEALARHERVKVLASLRPCPVARAFTSDLCNRYHGCRRKSPALQGGRRRPGDPAEPEVRGEAALMV